MSATTDVDLQRLADALVRALVSAWHRRQDARTSQPAVDQDTGGQVPWEGRAAVGQTAAQEVRRGGDALQQ